jgi:ferrous iron transport protein B
MNSTPTGGPAYIALTGNPNCGKTTLFNALTGLRAKVGNYAGVTVERKEGKLVGVPHGKDIRVIDLPGTYSLAPQSLDEQVSRDVLLSRLPELPTPELVVVVVDASNLQRNLYYATQVIELGHRTLIALNMVDVAEQNGHRIDAVKLTAQLGLPVVPVVASSGHGMGELRHEILALLAGPKPEEPRRFCKLPTPYLEEAQKIAAVLTWHFKERRSQADGEALLILGNEKALASSREHYPAAIEHAVSASRVRLEGAGVDWRSAAIEARYASVSGMAASVTTEFLPQGETLSDRMDRVLTHRVWGTLIFLVVIAVMFQSIFTFASYPMLWLSTGVAWVGGQLGTLLAPGELRSLLVDGVIAGVGAVLVFLPQILMLFLFIGFLEDTGYMARAAFLMDRFMSKVGLHGKSFIPMLSSFACAIPGIMATRTIETARDRLVTILIAPLMSCSARLPVYTLLIGACIPASKLFGVFGVRGLTLLGMYLLGISVALVMAWLFKKTLLKGEMPMLILELPPYKMPLPKQILRHMWDRAKVFIRQAGTVILGINILLWFLATYPKNHGAEAKHDAQVAAAVQGVFPDAKTGPEIEAKTRELEQQFSAQGGDAPVTAATSGEEPARAAYRQVQGADNELASEQLRHSFAGRLGRLIEPVIAPLGFDWKMGIGIVTSFAAREVFVSTMATVYSVEQAGGKEATRMNLVQTLQRQRRPDGVAVYGVVTGVTLMVFYVFALQCASTVAIVRRETNSWKWPLFQWCYMGTLAWGLAFAARHIGIMLGGV